MNYLTILYNFHEKISQKFKIYLFLFNYQFFPSVLIQKIDFPILTIYYLISLWYINIYEFNQLLCGSGSNTLIFLQDPSGYRTYVTLWNLFLGLMNFRMNEFWFIVFWNSRCTSGSRISWLSVFLVDSSLESVDI